MAMLMRYLDLGAISRRRELSILIVLGVMEGFSWTLIKPMLPLFASSLGAAELVIGLIVAMPPLVQIFTRIQSGGMAVRFGKRRMIIISFVLTMAGAAMFALTKSVPMLFVAQVFVALGESLFWPANWAYVTSLAPRRQQGKVVALVMAVQGGFGILMPYIGGRIFDLQGFWLNGLLYAVFAGIGLVTAFRLPAVEPAAPGRAAAAPLGDPGTSGTAGAAPKPVKLAGARALLAREWVLLAAWGGTIIFFSWGIHGAFYPIYVRSLGYTATTVGLLATWQSLFVTVTRFWYAKTGDRFPVDRAMLTAIFINAFPLMLLPFVRTLPLLMVVAAITGCAVSVIPVAIKTLYANATTDEERALAMGIDGVAMNAGALVSPVLAGAAAQNIGVPATFFAGNMLTLIALALARTVSRSRAVAKLLSGREPEPAVAP